MKAVFILFETKMSTLPVCPSWTCQSSVEPIATLVGMRGADFRRANNLVLVQPVAYRKGLHLDDTAPLQAPSTSPPPSAGVVTTLPTEAHSSDIIVMYAVGSFVRIHSECKHK